jgi:hypothetical protein
MTKQLLLVISLSAIVSIFILLSLTLTGERNLDAGASNITKGANYANGTQYSNTTDPTTTGTEANNITSTTSTTSSASMFLQEVIRALQTGNNEQANALLDAGQTTMSDAPDDARKQFEVGLRVLGGGDISEAIKYFEQANQTLG